MLVAVLGLFRRGDALLEATPETTLRARDVLTFQGTARALDALLARPDLAPAVEPVAEPALSTLPLYEAVVAPGSSLVGRTLRDADFREHYGGVVLAIQRAEEALEGSLGRIPLRAGDLLVMRSAGAYGFVMASNYNSRPRAAEVLVDGERYHVVRARETVDDLLRGESIPALDG